MARYDFTLARGPRPHEDFGPERHGSDSWVPPDGVVAVDEPRSTGPKPGPDAGPRESGCLGPRGPFPRKPVAAEGSAGRGPHGSGMGNERGCPRGPAGTVEPSPNQGRPQPRRGAPRTHPNATCEWHCLPSTHRLFAPSMKPCVHSRNPTAARAPRRATGPLGDRLPAPVPGSANRAMPSTPVPVSTLFPWMAIVVALVLGPATGRAASAATPPMCSFR